MLIRFHGPFEKLAEKEVELNIEGHSTAKQVLQRLVLIYPRLPFRDIGNSTIELNASVVLMRNGFPIRLSDTVSNTDVVEIFIPITGG